MTRLSARALLRNTGLNPQVGLRGRLQSAGASSVRTWLAAHPEDSEIFWLGQSATTLLSNGAMGEKITVVVVGDGFAAGDQALYDAKVHQALTDPIKGLFARDFFADNRSAFNVIRINLVSAQSGASTREYDDESGLPTSTVTRDTALGVYYNGQWNHCWVEDGPDTARRLEQALSIWAPEHSIVWVLLNNPGGGGCGGGGRMTTGRGISWSTVAHELGHAVANLADEYCGEGTWTASEPRAVNITTNTDPSTLKWRDLVKAGAPIPTGLNDETDLRCAGYTEGTGKPADWDDARDVGLFEGATLGQQRYNQGVYRPAISCRMRSNSDEFCGVCRRAMQTIIDPHLRRPATGGRRRTESEEGYLRLLIRSDQGSLRLVSARRLPGPLTQPSTVTYGLAHEVHLDGRRIALGSMPDVATSRSMNDPADGPEVHHGYELGTFDFVVRVPVADLRGADLNALSLSVVDVQSSQHQPTLTNSLRDDPMLSVRPVSTLALRTRPEVQAAIRTAIRSDT